MKAQIFILFKYWKKHLKSLFAFIFSGALLTAIVFAMLMSAREECARFYNRVFDFAGHHDILIANSNDELLSKVNEVNNNYDYGVINVFGEMGYKETRFTYGTISDEHNIWHIPLDEGRMPETENEIATLSSVLDAFHWVGKCGGTITIDGKEYMVTGIIGSDYENQRPIYNPLSSSNLLHNQVRYSPYRIPLIFVGKNNLTPLYRIDLIGNFFSANETTEDIESFIDYLGEFSTYAGIMTGSEAHWFDCRSDSEIIYVRTHSQPTKFMMIIAWIGAAVAALSVYSVLRMIFIKRRGRIEVLKRIGMPKRRILYMYIFECVCFAIIQTLIGLIVGLAAYGGIWLFRTGVLCEKLYSAFTDLAIVIEKTFDPVLFACLISVAVLAAAYLINVIAAKVKVNAVPKNAKPRSLDHCFSAAFKQSKITVVQLISLTLISFSVMMGYMFYTDNGKEVTPHLTYIPHMTSYTANGFDMEKNNITEYYYCSSPTVYSLGHMDKEPINQFPVIVENFSAGFDDEIASQLPRGSLITGKLEQTFIASDEPYMYLSGIDLSNEVVRETFLGLSDDKYKNFFDEDEIGSQNMYRIFTRLVPSDTINGLSDCITAGSIDIDALNGGKEILLVQNSQVLPFKTGEFITVYSAAANENGFGVKDIKSANVKIGAIIQIPPEIGEIERYTVLGEGNYGFLTTAQGANAMGFPGAAYTELYSHEEIDGSIFPSSAEMKFESLLQMKQSHILDTIMKYSGVTFILLLMMLLGFAGYFNGIGLKISQKKYEISIFRAVGAPMKDIRKRVFLDSFKVPVASSALSYGLSKLAQFIMKSAYFNMLSLYEDTSLENAHDRIMSLINTFFLDNVMWEVNVEIPSLILLFVLCAITFILTAAALKKFKGNIADDINIGRTRE